MSSPPVVVPTGTSIAAAARIMDSEDVKRLAVIDDVGRLVGIVSRSDLLKVHLRPDIEILVDIEEEVLRTIPTDDANRVNVAVVNGVVTLSGRVHRWSAMDLAVRLTRQIAGVVDVTCSLEYAVDDRELLGGRAFGAP
jgi:CBS-domain-containing membrane protein